MACTNNEERLLKVLLNVNDWLKFGEAKNAMLIAFNGAAIFGIGQLYQLQAVKESPFFSWWLLIAAIVLVFSVIVSLMSFVPRLKVSKTTLQSYSGRPNSLFYGYLCTKDEVSIIQAVCESELENFTRFELDIAHQIKVNSLIATAKFNYFKVAVWITISALITPAFGFIFYLLKVKDEF